MPSEEALMKRAADVQPYAAPPAAAAPPPAMAASDWETANAKMLDNPALKKGPPDHHDAGDRRSAEEARVHAGVQGITGRAHLD